MPTQRVNGTLHLAAADAWTWRRAAFILLGVALLLSSCGLRAQLAPSMPRAPAAPHEATVGASTGARMPAAAGARHGGRARSFSVVTAVDSIGLTVSDLDRAVDFYTGVLAFEPVATAELAGAPWETLLDVAHVRLRRARLRLGHETIELTEVRPHGRPLPPDSRSTDRSFQHVAIIVSDMDRAYARLRSHGVAPISAGPQRLPDWNPAAGGIEAFYFADPDGHALEILEFPAGKGDPRWQRRDGTLFLGIDHTAIVVDDTAASLAFYGDLGLTVAGESLNHGIEQERLSGVPGARVRITSVRAPAAGPGVEFLEYLEPEGGRPYPSDGRATDLVHWQTRLVACDLDTTALRLRARGTTFLSREVVALHDAALDFTRAVVIRDPDGHALELVDGGASQRRLECNATTMERGDS
jgi:catechol 2,3-dioxygenase-like lactoylglutathione lyase family enzyme